MVLRIKEREKKPSSYQLWTRRSMVNYSRFIGMAMVLMQKPSMIKSPSGRMPKKAPRWDLTGIEGCGGGKVFSWILLVVWEYLGIYIGQRIRSGESRGEGTRQGARPPSLWPCRGSSDLNSKSQGCLLVQEKSSRWFCSVWTPFGILSLQSSKQGKKKVALGSRLIGQSQKYYKIAY